MPNNPPTLREDHVQNKLSCLFFCAFPDRLWRGDGSKRDFVDTPDPGDTTLALFAGNLSGVYGSADGTGSAASFAWPTGKLPIVPAMFMWRFLKLYHSQDHAGWGGQYWRVLRTLRQIRRNRCDSELWDASRVAADSAGNIYVADYLNAPSASHAIRAGQLRWQVL